MGNPLPITVNAESAPQCQHVNARGHRCRMLTSGSYDSLCLHHLNLLKAERLKNDEAVAAELLGNVEDFSSAYEVHQFLGNLLKQLVHKRVRRRDAMAQAYLCQLLLNTFPYLRQEAADETARRDQEFIKNYLAAPRAPLLAKQDSAGNSAA